MDESMNIDGIAKKVLIHLYNSAVVGCMSSVSMMIRMQSVKQQMNPRLKELQETFEALGPERRQLFYGAIASIAQGLRIKLYQDRCRHG
jgi:hypothetical protein